MLRKKEGVSMLCEIFPAHGELVLQYLLFVSTRGSSEWIVQSGGLL